MNTDRAYLSQVKQHLARYKVEVLGVNEPGYWGEPPRRYGHILPRHLRHLNIVPSIQNLFWQVREEPSARWHLHRYFHHLSSSQALAFNLFFSPAHPDLPKSFRATRRLLGLSTTSDCRVEFEAPINSDPGEGTSIDVLLTESQDKRTIIEVKYTEATFGRARADERHLKKLRRYYGPMLRGRIAEECLDPLAFFPDYQLYRNLAHVRPATADRVILLIPRARPKLWAHATSWCKRSALASLAHCINVVALEDVVAALESDSANDGLNDARAIEVAAKYLPTVT